MPTSRRQSATIDWLQALRGLAAVCVVITHAGWTLSQPEHKEIAWHYLAHGALGVDLFFVISGFIMFLTTRNSDGSRRYAADFAIKRFARVWPLFFVVSMVYLVIEWSHAHAFPIAYFHDIASQLVFRPVSPKPSEFFHLPVDVAWTLCFEAYFYVVMAISLLSRRWRWWIVAALLAPGLVLHPVVTQDWDFSFYHQPAVEGPHYLNLMVSPMVWEFVLGLAAGWIYTSDWSKPPRQIAIAMLLGACTLFVTIPELHIPTMYGPTFENGGLIVFAIFMMIALASKTIDLPLARWIVWLGTISYSIYLTHKLGFMIAAHLTEVLDIPDANRLDWLRFALYLGCGVTMGAVFHYAVEAPLSSQVRKLLLSFGKKRSQPDFVNSGAHST